MNNKEAFEYIKDYFKEPSEEVSKWFRFNIVEEGLTETQVKIKRRFKNDK